MSAGSRSHYGSRTSVPFGSATPKGRGGAARRGAVSRAVLEALEVRRLLTTFPVTTTADGGAGSPPQAVILANAAAGPPHAPRPPRPPTPVIPGAHQDAGPDRPPGPPRRVAGPRAR